MNGAALTFTLLATLCVSITWEVSLAIPGGWWGYRHEAMIGLAVKPWNNLPLEAVMVWVLVVFAAVVTWEAVQSPATARRFPSPFAYLRAGSQMTHRGSATR